MARYIAGYKNPGQVPVAEKVFDRFEAAKDFLLDEIELMLIHEQDEDRAVGFNNLHEEICCWRGLGACWVSAEGPDGYVRFIKKTMG